MCTGFVIYVVHASSGLFWAIYSEHGSKVGKEFNAFLISLKHLITPRRQGYLQVVVMVRVLTETFISTAMQEKNPMYNYWGFQ